MHVSLWLYACVLMFYCVCPYALMWMSLCYYVCVLIYTGKSYYILVRWFEAHPDAWERDDMCRPLCPGPLRHNHCLWRYAVTQRPRRIMTSQDGAPSQVFRSQQDIFGSDDRTVNLRWSEEQHAYYGLVSPSSVLSTVSMSREYDGGSMSYSSSWLETVTISW